MTTYAALLHQHYPSCLHCLQRNDVKILLRQIPRCSNFNQEYPLSIVPEKTIYLLLFIQICIKLNSRLTKLMNYSSKFPRLRVIYINPYQQKLLDYFELKSFYIIISFEGQGLICVKNTQYMKYHKHFTYLIYLILRIVYRDQVVS